LRATLQSLFVSQRLAMLMSKEHHSHIERLGGFLESGSVVPAVGRRYRLDQVPTAIDDLVAGRAAGKSVIVVRDSATARDGLRRDSERSAE